LSKSAPLQRSAELGPVRVLLFARVIAAGLFAALPALAWADNSPDVALARLLDEARSAAAAPGRCTEPGIDRLIRMFCAQRIRVGIKKNYPLFSTHAGDEWQGYEVDVARAVAGELGVDIDFTNVNAVTRIPELADDSVDLVIAAMGHNTQRDSQVRFIRPHYYQSETILVGSRDLRLVDWNDIRGLTVCVPPGNGSNAELVSHGARLMLFDEPIERLSDGTCALAAHDDSLVYYYFTNPSFAARFSEKFGFVQVPWGMAVARDGSDLLARALGLVSQIFHRDGTFLAVARANLIGTGFLLQQQVVWALPECNTDTGSTNPVCILPPFNVAQEMTPFAAGVTAFESWFAEVTGFDLLLPMLKTAPAWSLFLDGVVNSLVLIAGALSATLAFAMLFGVAMGTRSRLLRWPARSITIALQSSPTLLTLVIVAAIIHALVPYSSTTALSAAIVALGLSNGSNAGQAISEAYLTLRAERRGLPVDLLELFSRALSRSATQIVAFLINAAKGTPVASFIGAPELLMALTDITSFSSGRETTYTLLLVFYTAVVMAVIWACRRLQGFFERNQAVA
jgi:polar amino acid transport system substrate-binding protein